MEPVVEQGLDIPGGGGIRLLTSLYQRHVGVTKGSSGEVTVVMLCYLW